LIGQPVRNRDVAEIYDPATCKVLGQVRDRVFSAQETGHEKGAIISGQEGRQYRGERVILPMADKDGKARYLLGATCNTDLHDLYPAEETAAELSNKPPAFTRLCDVLASFSP